MKKTCSKCKVEKDIDDFGVRTLAKDGHRNVCKHCRRVPPKDKKSSEDIRKRKQSYQKTYSKQYRAKNQAKSKQYAREYYHKNKKTIRQQNNERDMLRYKEDPAYRIIHLLRRRVRRSVRNISPSKQLSTMEYLGCDQRTLLEWLQWSGERFDSKFNIHTYDTSLYHIDHRKTFEDVKKGVYTLEEVAHYTNLQILPSDINLSKGGTSWIE